MDSEDLRGYRRVVEEEISRLHDIEASMRHMMGALQVVMHHLVYVIDDPVLPDQVRTSGKGVERITKALEYFLWARNMIDEARLERERRLREYRKMEKGRDVQVVGA